MSIIIIINNNMTFLVSVDWGTLEWLLSANTLVL